MTATQTFPQQLDTQMGSMATIPGATNISMSSGNTATIAGSALVGSLIEVVGLAGRRAPPALIEVLNSKELNEKKDYGLV